jgi:hypothetical protein
MGIRGEIFSTKVILQNRTYFFNVKENRLGDLYLNIVESKNKETGGFDRQSVILFADDLQEFLSGFDESLRVMEKAVREKRRSVPKPPGRRSAPPEAERDGASHEAVDRRAPGRGSVGGDFQGRRPASGPKRFSRKTEGGFNAEGKGPKRAVVKRGRPAGKDGESRGRDGDSGGKDWNHGGGAARTPGRAVVRRPRKKE